MTDSAGSALQLVSGARRGARQIEDHQEQALGGAYVWLPHQRVGPQSEVGEGLAPRRMGGYRNVIQGNPSSNFQQAVLGMSRDTGWTSGRAPVGSEECQGVPQIVAPCYVDKKCIKPSIHIHTNRNNN